MAVIINEAFRKKAEELKSPLKTKTVFPENKVIIKNAPDAFQGLKAEAFGKAEFPLVFMANDEIILDFGDHYTGYLSFSLENDGLIKITDAPVKLHFYFGEFPFEITADPEEYKGGLGSGWLQNEERSYVFTPCEGILERRYSFRYLKIKRTDNTSFPIMLTSLKLKAVSAVTESDAPKLNSDDKLLQKIYSMSVKTLKECQQDVYEDGPKRDRRLWIGDLKLQAMTDYGIFRNLDLIKRCIYLFASATGNHKMVAPCIFPDSPPYVDNWTFCDYSLFFISCLYDWYKNTGDIALIEELFEVAYTQFDIISGKFDRKTGIIEINPFIDWCPKLDKKTAQLGVYIYTLKQLKELCTLLNRDTKKVDEEIAAAEKCILGFFDGENGLFVAPSGQLSQHSQVWAVLSGILKKEEAVKLLGKMKSINTEFTMRTPYMMHYYIEALYSAGLKQEALDFIKDYWGKIAYAGFDCCPEVFNPENDFESPYNAPEINSACHAWSCTPAYWIPKLLNEGLK